MPPPLNVWKLVIAGPLNEELNPASVLNCRAGDDPNVSTLDGVPGATTGFALTEI